MLMTRHGFLELTGSSFRGLAPLAGACSCGRECAAAPVERLRLCAGGRSGRDQSAASLGARSVPAGGRANPPTHRHRAHARPPCAGITQPPYAAAYCVTSGWMNPLCDTVEALDARRGGVRGARTAASTAPIASERPHTFAATGRPAPGRHRCRSPRASVRPVRKPFQTADRSTAGEPRSSCRWPRVHWRDASDGTAASR